MFVTIDLVWQNFSVDCKIPKYCQIANNLGLVDLTIFVATTTSTTEA